MVIESLQSNPPLDEKLDVIESTGPVFISRILAQISEQQRNEMNIFTPERERFNPRSPRNAREHKAIVERGVAYGIHHCHGTWRQWTLAQRIRSRISGMIHRFV